MTETRHEGRDASADTEACRLAVHRGCQCACLEAAKARILAGCGDNCPHPLIGYAENGEILSQTSAHSRNSFFRIDRITFSIYQNTWSRGIADESSLHPPSSIRDFGSSVNTSPRIGDGSEDGRGPGQDTVPGTVITVAGTIDYRPRDGAARPLDHQERANGRTENRGEGCDGRARKSVARTGSPRPHRCGDPRGDDCGNGFLQRRWLGGRVRSGAIEMSGRPARTHLDEDGGRHRASRTSRRSPPRVCPFVGARREAQPMRARRHQ